jgi:hypothetical protein
MAAGLPGHDTALKEGLDLLDLFGVGDASPFASIAASTIIHSPPSCSAIVRSTVSSNFLRLAMMTSHYGSFIRFDMYRLIHNVKA